jgi:2-oxo-3-hexenedioate decarboxylase
MQTPARPLRAALFAGLVLAGQGVGAAEPDLDYMARLIAEAADGRRPYPELARLNPTLDLDALYGVQDRYVRARLARGERVGGFKGGFIPQHPIGGVLFAGGLRERPAEVRRGDFHALLVEAEIAFELCSPVHAPLVDVAAVKAVVCRLRPAVELPDAALHDLGTLKQDLPRLARALVPTDIATRDVALGPAVDAARVQLAAVEVSVRHDATVLGVRPAGVANEALWDAVRWVINEFALARGYKVEAGQIVMPGNLTGLHPGQPGRWRIEYGGLGAVEFRIVE